MGAPRARRHPDVAAVFDPLGNAVHTALAFPLVGEDVLVTGAGPIGLMAVGRRPPGSGRATIVVTDVSPARLELARTLGVDLAVDVTVSSRRCGAASSSA